MTTSITAAQDFVARINEQTAPLMTDGELAGQLKAALMKQEDATALMDTARSQWVDATLELALTLAEARKRFPADRDFSQWLSDEGVAIDRNRRAALIALGQEPERARDTLEKTTKTSVRRIVELEFRPKPAPVSVMLPPAQQVSKAKAAVSADEVRFHTPVTPMQPANANEVSALKEENKMLRAEVAQYERLIGEVFKEVVKDVKEEVTFALNYGLRPILTDGRTKLSQSEFKQIMQCAHPDKVKHIDDPELTQSHASATQTLLRLRKHIVVADKLEGAKAMNSSDLMFETMLKDVERRVRTSKSMSGEARDRAWMASTIKMLLNRIKTDHYNAGLEAEAGATKREG